MVSLLHYLIADIVILSAFVLLVSSSYHCTSFSRSQNIADKFYLFIHSLSSCITCKFVSGRAVYFSTTSDYFMVASVGFQPSNISKRKKHSKELSFFNIDSVNYECYDIISSNIVSSSSFLNGTDNVSVPIPSFLLVII